MKSIENYIQFTKQQTRKLTSDWFFQEVLVVFGITFAYLIISKLILDFIW